MFEIPKDLRALLPQKMPCSLKSDYHIFAGFDEGLIEGSRYLDQIHITIRF